MPSEFFRTSTTWVVDFRYEGRPRRWFKAFGPGVDVRTATDEEEAQYLRGEEPKNAFCPVGRDEI